MAVRYDNEMLTLAPEREQELENRRQGIAK